MQVGGGASWQKVVWTHGFPAKNTVRLRDSLTSQPSLCSRTFPSLWPHLPGLRGPRTRVVNLSTQALRIFSGVAGLSSRKSSVVLLFVSDSLRPHGLQPTRLLCPWDFPGENTGVGCHRLLRAFALAMCKPGFPGGSVVKNPPANAGDTGPIPGSGRSPGGVHGNPLQYSCLENPMERRVWQAIIHRVTKSWT